MPNANEDRFLGALLGLAIGDALGMPVAGRSRREIADRFGRIEGYHPWTFGDGVEVKAGEFTDESEIALCVVESLTANNGLLDPDNVGARMLFLARGESRRWLRPDTRAALERADASLVFRVPLDEDAPATGEVAARGVPVGLLHAVGGFDPETLWADAEAVVRLTHGSPAAVAAAAAVAFGVRLAARGESPPARWAIETAEFLDRSGGGEVAAGLRRADALRVAARSLPETLAELGTGTAAREAVPAAFASAMAAELFEDAVVAAASAGGETDTVGAIAGALAGAAAGASGIPQRLIDGLEGRIYVSLAAPWFYRTAMRRGGLLIDLRPDDPNQPRPAFPPRV